MTHRVPFGHRVKNIIPEGASGNYIECVAINKNLVAAGDETRQIKVYRNPCCSEVKPDHVVLRGHSFKPSNLDFVGDRLITMGGHD
jgi:hypothetical protein